MANNFNNERFKKNRFFKITQRGVNMPPPHFLYNAVVFDGGGWVPDDKNIIAIGWKLYFGRDTKI